LDVHGVAKPPQLAGERALQAVEACRIGPTASGSGRDPGGNLAA
jgi:hypothetical protein